MQRTHPTSVPWMLAIAALIGVPAARAQLPGAPPSVNALRPGTLRGTVYDSVAGRPLAEARVELALEEDPARTPLHAVTDSSGHFALDGLPPGRYLAGFEHPRLDSLGIAAPVRRIAIAEGRSASLDLAIPSSDRIRVALCGDSAIRQGSGVLVGNLVDARDHRPIDGGTVTAEWLDVIIDSAGITRETESAVAQSGPGGWFALCGAPVGGDIFVHAAHDADSTGMLEVSVTGSGLVVLPLAVGHVEVALEGTVLRATGEPLAGAHVTVGGSTLETVTDDQGRFAFAGIPSGTRTIETRRVGYFPDTRSIELSDAAGSTNAVQITLSTVRSVLDTIRVTANRVYDHNLQEFARRRRSEGSGDFLDEEQITRIHAIAPMEILRRSPAVQIIPVAVHGQITYRVRSRGTTSLTGPTDCLPNVWVDGTYVPLDRSLEELDQFVDADEIVGVEIYQGDLAPPQFSRPESNCESIVIWTRPAGRRHKR